MFKKQIIVIAAVVLASAINCTRVLASDTTGNVPADMAETATGSAVSVHETQFYDWNKVESKVTAKNPLTAKISEKIKFSGVIPFIISKYDPKKEKYTNYLRIYTDANSTAFTDIFPNYEAVIDDFKEGYIRLFKSSKKDDHSEKALVGTFKWNTLNETGISMSKYGIDLTDKIYVQPVVSCLADCSLVRDVLKKDIYFDDDVMEIPYLAGKRSKGIPVTNPFVNANSDADEEIWNRLLDSITQGDLYWNSYGLPSSVDVHKVWNIASTYPSRSTPDIPDHVIFISDTYSAKKYHFSSIQCFGFAELVLKMTTADFSGSSTMFKVDGKTKMSDIVKYSHVRLHEIEHSFSLKSLTKAKDGTVKMVYRECNPDYKTNILRTTTRTFKSWSECRTWLINRGAVIIN